VNGAVVDNENFNATRRNILAMQDSGWMNTTLAEIKNRCDVLLVIGTDLEVFSPRFFDLFIWNQDSMFVDDTSQREIIFLGKPPEGNAAVSPSQHQPRVIECTNEHLPEVLSVLRALIKNMPMQASTVNGITLTELQQLAETLKKASYSVITWSAAAQNYAHADLTVQTTCELVKDLNLTTRCSGFPLGGREGDQTANQVCGWITGYPARSSFSSGFPEYDPFLFDTELMLNNGEADSLLWVQAFNSSSTPPETSMPSIVLGRSGMTFDQEPNVFIPVGTPGIDHAGHAYRLDNVVAIRLKKLRDSGLPSSAEVLTAIQQAL
ncbi:MAG: formylmethanofuran dehydrogenase subunit B, partial [Gammaproteobacteria bacterium]|nr:formylmethanofuran dehydrogenase subunit B [Gammaproteobacteria bacterium]